MRTFTFLAVIGVIALAASGAESIVIHRGKMASTEINFESRHLSIEQCDSMNNLVGREMKWNNTDESFIDTAAGAETIETTIVVRKTLTTEKTPAWVSEIQQKGETYQVEKKRKAKRNEERLSAYSKTELSIAKFMGLNPWDIDREQLRRWGQDIDMPPSRF